MRPPPILSPGTIGILGGGQLGRMLALAARAMGYRIAIQDPDPDCPAAAVADRVILGGYDDVRAARELGQLSDVVTYELEHVAVDVVDALADRVPVRPGRVPLLVTQDRLAERRFIESAGVQVAAWRAVRTTDDLHTAAEELGLPLRLKATTGGYDGRGQLRLAAHDEFEDAFQRLGRPPDLAILVERELEFEAEVSIIVTRGVDGQIAAFPLARNVHDRGVLADSVAPAPVAPEIAASALTLGERLAVEMDLVGTLTVELFLMPDGRLVVNELAPRVHNSGHWTIEGAATSQFEQHIRAICGLGLGATHALAPTAMVNLLGTGPRRPARLDGVAVALADPALHLHVYDKREVFERRKMGHLTAVGETTGTADAPLAKARAAAAEFHWVEDKDEETGR